MSAPVPPQHVLPRTATEVIELLERAFPLRTFPVDTPLHAIQREYGKRDVIDFLIRLRDEE